MKFRMMGLARVALVVAAVAFLGGAVMLLWNLVLPGVFPDSPQLDYWHALGLLILSRILFGGFRGHGGWHGHRHWHKWQTMTPDERERFHRRWHGQGHEHGHGHEPGRMHGRQRDAQSNPGTEP